MAFTTERITDMICGRLEEYGYDYGGHMSPKLYPIYLKVAGVIQIRLGLPRGFTKTNMEDRELFKQVREALDIMLPPKEKEEKPANKFMKHAQ